MNCCNDSGECRQGRSCNTLWRRRLQAISSAAGYAAVAILMLGCAAMAAAGWVQQLTS